jgi:NAD(P)-dependent dehydrogenase (short-subunit alcohol dehydrogenase family)
MTGMVEGKSAIVTGAASGIGRESARLFAREGARVVVADLNKDGGEETVRQIVEAGGAAVFQQTDISDAEQVGALVDRAVKEFGQLDCAHNNAGVAGNVGPVGGCSDEDWDRTIAVNLTGTFYCMRAEINAMLANDSGVIVNTASTFGIVGAPGMPSYVSSKHAVMGLTRGSALDYAKAGLRINAVCPGVIDTPMVQEHLAHLPENPFLAIIPSGRMAHPSEVAEAAVWLCSDRASYVNGVAMTVDSGWTAQ